MQRVPVKWLITGKCKLVTLYINNVLDHLSTYSNHVDTIERNGYSILLLVDLGMMKPAGIFSRLLDLLIISQVDCFLFHIEDY